MKELIECLNCQAVFMYVNSEVHETYIMIGLK